MGNRKHNKNLSVAKRILMELGATVLEERTDGRHIRIHVRTAEGNLFWYGLSQATSERYKLEGWLRQQVHRADARVVHYAEKNRR